MNVQMCFIVLKDGKENSRFYGNQSLLEIAGANITNKNGLTGLLVGQDGDTVIKVFHGKNNDFPTIEEVNKTIRDFGLMRKEI